MSNLDGVLYEIPEEMAMTLPQIIDQAKAGLADLREEQIWQKGQAADSHAQQHALAKKSIFKFLSEAIRPMALLDYVTVPDKVVLSDFVYGRQVRIAVTVPNAMPVYFWLVREVEDEVHNTFRFKSQMDGYYAVPVTLQASRNKMSNQVVYEPSVCKYFDQLDVALGYAIEKYDDIDAMRELARDQFLGREDKDASPFNGYMYESLQLFNRLVDEGLSDAAAAILVLVETINDKDMGGDY
jgi:hypothetical protein